MDAQAFRAQVLALEGVTEAPHVDRTAFRVRRIFASLAPDGLSANLKLTPEDQAFHQMMAPEAFRPLANKWGAQGWTEVRLGSIDAEGLATALAAAHAFGSRR